MKKKWVSWLLIALAALLVVAGILWLRYGNKLFYRNVFVDAENQISFAYPDNRTVVTGATNPYLVATIASPDISEYTPIFNVTREHIPNDMSIDVYVGQTMQQLKEVIVGFHENGTETLNVDGRPARKVLFSGRYLDQDFSWEQIYAIKDSTIYVMTYLAPTDIFTGDREEIQTSFSTFSFQQ